MVDVSKFKNSFSKYLKASDVKEKPAQKFYILDSGEFIKDQWGKDKLEMRGMFNDEEKIFTSNVGNARFIAEKLGDDTTKWINARLRLSTIRVQRPDGTKTDAIEVIGVERPDEVEATKIQSN